MITTLDKEKDFFISYTGKDENWATWIAETLENAGYSTIIQAWDFKAGGSFINDMNEAIKICSKVILVLSEKEHPDTAATYNNIASVYDRQGDYPKALEWYRKALDIFERKLGSEHPNTKTVKENIKALEQ